MQTLTLTLPLVEPSARNGHSAVVYSGSMYVFGGDDGSKKNDVWELDLETKKWSLVTTIGTKPSARIGHSAVVHSGSMYVFGGEDSSSKKQDVWKLDLGTNQWSEVTTTGTKPSARIGHSAIVYNGKMYVFGGDDGSKKQDVWKLDLTTTQPTWSEVTTTGTKPSAVYFDSNTKLVDKYIKLPIPSIKIHKSGQSNTISDISLSVEIKEKEGQVSDLKPVEINLYKIYSSKNHLKNMYIEDNSAGKMYFPLNNTKKKYADLYGTNSIEVQNVIDDYYNITIHNSLSDSKDQVTISGDIIHDKNIIKIFLVKCQIISKIILIILKLNWI